MSRARFLPVLALTSSITAVSPRPAAAQRAVIIGVVRDTSGVQIPHAEAVLVKARKVDRATDRGWFVFDSTEAGADMLIVRAIGYRVERLPIDLGEADTLELEVVLAPAAQVLPELVVKAYGRELTGVAASSARRMLLNGAPASGLITREDIAGWGKFDLANVFRRAGLVVQGDRAACPERGAGGMTVYIDGLPQPDDPEADYQRIRYGKTLNVRRVPPADVEAIEVYRSVATRPVEFNPTGSIGCLVLIWTRR